MTGERSSGRLRGLPGDARGSVVIYAFLIPALVIFCGFVIDVGRFLEARGRLQTIADASSLAGVSAARVVAEKEYALEQRDGQDVVVEKIISERLCLDEAEADALAEFTAALNGAGSEYWRQRGGAFEGWTGRKISDDEYYTAARARLSPGFFYPVWRALGKGPGVPVFMDGIAKAYLYKPQGKGGGSP